jgi:endonuclease IV
MSLSRRERRGVAKQLGILSKKESYQEMLGRFERSNKAGEYLHTHHVQEIKNSEIESRAEESTPLSEGDSINPYGFLGKR